MRRVVVWLIAIVATGLLIGTAGLAYVRMTGLSARAEPSRLEAKLARAVRSFAISRRDRERTNPVTRSEEAVRAGLEHFADHCALCHANDGSGDTPFGRGMFPPSPDLRGEATQRMTDGELFFIIENGVRFTGMPAFATGTAESEAESWNLVHFLRRLPHLSEAELERMKELNPRPPEDIRQEIAEERFLRGESP
jgi:mono/diheme cytochrome c family protein